MAEIPSPIRPEIAGKPETPNKIQLQTNWNAMESFFQDKDSMATPRIKQNIAALNDPDKSGYDPRDLSKKIKTERVDAGGKPLPAEEITIQQVIKENVDELERLADLKPAADAPAEEAAKITAQAAEAQKLLEEMDKSLEVEVKGEARSLTREVYKARVKAARKQATDDAPKAYEQDRKVPMDDPPTPEQVTFIAAEAQKAEDQLEGKYSLRFRPEVKAEKLPGTEMEQVNQVIDEQIDQLARKLFETNNPNEIAKLVEDLGYLQLVRLFEGNTRLSAYGKYLALQRLQDSRDIRVIQALEKLDGQPRIPGSAKTQGLIEGWQTELQEVPELVNYFREKGLEAFVSLTAVNELRALMKTGLYPKLEDAMAALQKKIAVTGIDLQELPVDMQEGSIARQLYNDKSGFLSELTQAVYGRPDATLSELVKQTRAEFRKALKGKIKDNIKKMWGYTKSGTLILMLLALMMSAEGEQGGGGQQGG